MITLSIRFILIVTIASIVIVSSADEPSLKGNDVYPSPEIIEKLYEAPPSNIEVNNSKKIRIVGGNEAIPNEYPFMVLIKTTVYSAEGSSDKKNTNKKDSFICGGSLISSRWIVTAAHCLSKNKRGGRSLGIFGENFESDESETVRKSGESESKKSYNNQSSPLSKEFKHLNDFHVKKRIEPKQEHKDKNDASSISPDDVIIYYGSNIRSKMQTIKPRRIIVHPYANLFTFSNDIALIELESDLKFSAQVAPIKISTATIYKSQPVTAIGYGMSKQNSNSPASSLMQATLTTGIDGPIDFSLIEESPANKSLNSTEDSEISNSSSSCKNIRRGFVDNNDDVICCPIKSGKDTCFGDSGGPLISRINASSTIQKNSTYSKSGIYSTSKTLTDINEYVLVGITSYGDTTNNTQYSCGGINGFGFYTRPAFFLDFITSTTGLSIDDITSKNKLSPIEVIPLSTNRSSSANSIKRKFKDLVNEYFYICTFLAFYHIAFNI
ncbi:Chymotrypsin-1 [Smittium culicis]|uniref:Chymotrypsin-1 n=1 Tax=Smittium culicis TaxID=133412 RepID=A0A1R1YC20_9FUNG|nr:Chymotrypsin-1 [Smittium culicis]